jgi:hypothetical protein
MSSDKSTKTHIRPEAIDAYYELLERPFSTSDFYIRMIASIQSDPYLFAPYLEMADYLQVGGLQDERRSLLTFACMKADEIVSNPLLLNEAYQKWTAKEGKTLLAIIKKAQDSGVKMPGGFFTMRARKLSTRLRPETARAAKNLVLIQKEADLASIREEIFQNEICWIANTARQDNIAVHKDTNAIVLRMLTANKEGIFTAIDGSHESERSPYWDLFPQTVGLIERFAASLEGGLGRVALVRLKPHSMVYRHYDGEPWLIGRNRYHLVIKSTQGSLMSSGTETRYFSEGDLFLFNNKVMHTAENNSDDWRIHAIFDMQVPKHRDL